MTTIIVADGQNLFDIASQYYGGSEGVHQIFKDNPAVSFDTDLVAGQEVQIDESVVVDKRVLDEIQKNNLKFNTGN